MRKNEINEKKLKMKIHKIYLINLLLLFFFISSAYTADCNDLPDSKFIVSYVSSLTGDSPIVFYAKEFLKRGYAFNENELDTIFNLIIPKIFDFENEANVSFFYLGVPSNTDLVQIERHELKFEYKKSKKKINLNFDFIGNFKSDSLYFSLFEIIVLPANENIIVKTEEPVKRARLKNNALLQIKINEKFSLYKIYNMDRPFYFIGAGTKYQGQNIPKKIFNNNLIDTFIPGNYPANLETLIQTGIDSFNISELTKLPKVGEIFIPEAIILKEDKYDTFINALSPQDSIQIPLISADTSKIKELSTVPDTSNNYDSGIKLIQPDNSNLITTDSQALNPNFKINIFTDTNTLNKILNNDTIPQATDTSDTEGQKKRTKISDTEK